MKCNTFFSRANQGHSPDNSRPAAKLPQTGKKAFFQRNRIAGKHPSHRLFGMRFAPGACACMPGQTRPPARQGFFA
jgi:hypothetical protein